MRNSKLFLRDILDAMDAIESFVGDMDLGTFVKDDKTSSAVIRKFEIIGEAARNIPDDMRRKHPQVPWQEMAGLRNILIHAYFGIKHDLVWRTIKDVLPRVKPLIESILKP